MDLKSFALISGNIFIAELGDKTHLATILYAAEGRISRVHVFAAAALALVVATAINVAGGACSVSTFRYAICKSPPASAS
jgi:putative Ca2+/H+ antiporter (TMEM165/GDT1 family)